uniref:Uncharacterized protein n=1 Tax=Micrurus paraensis TaxID=1970185 RepID=A0A2D4KM35_9SAUR
MAYFYSLPKEDTNRSFSECTAKRHFQQIHVILSKVEFFPSHLFWGLIQLINDKRVQVRLYRIFTSISHFPDVLPVIALEVPGTAEFQLSRKDLAGFVLLLISGYLLTKGSFSPKVHYHNEYDVVSDSLGVFKLRVNWKSFINVDDDFLL